MGRRRRTIIWIAIVAGAALVAVAATMRPSRKGQREEPAREVRPERGDLRVLVTTSGLVEPQNRLEVRPPISGRIEKVLVREGDVVKQGDTLAWMSSTERAALLDAARSQGAKEVAYWEDVYKPAPLVAPLDGTVIVRAVEPGQTVTSQDAPLVLADRLIVKAQVDETDIGQVKTGQSAEIVLDAYPEDKVRATVDHIAYESRIVNNVTIYDVDILPGKVPEVFRSGMSANVTIMVADRKDALLLPVEALRDSEGGKQVVVKPVGGGRPVPRTVKVGMTDGKMVEVLSGIGEEDSVLIARRREEPEKPARTNPFMPFGRMRSRQTSRPPRGPGP